MLLLCGVIMLTATAFYLLAGFLWNLWHIGWVVYPAGGILCAIVSILLKKDASWRQTVKIFSAIFKQILTNILRKLDSTFLFIRLFFI